MSQHENDPTVDLAIRRARARQDRRCTRCGTARPLGGGDLCYECSRIDKGLSGTEQDHLAGRVAWGSLEVRLRANDHRTVSELRSVLGFDRLPEVGDDPLLLLAHLLAGIATLFGLLVEYLVGWSTELRLRHGDDYAAGLRSPVV